MGTNYYLHRNVCEHCGRSDERIHIGKSSSGWCFSLHVIPGEIENLAEWEATWPSGTIKDEYDEVIGPEEMMKTITDRDAIKAKRHEDRFCVGHGEGPWDLIEGDFS